MAVCVVETVVGFVSDKNDSRTGLDVAVVGDVQQQFIRDLLLKGMIRQRNIRLAACANRVRSSMPVYQPLERFLASLGMPLLGRVMDSDVYLKSAETGIGVFEMEFAQSAAERQQLMPIVEWMETPQIRLEPKILQPRPSVLASVPGRDLRVVTSSIPAFLTKAS